MPDNSLTPAQLAVYCVQLQHENVILKQQLLLLTREAEACSNASLDLFTIKNLLREAGDTEAERKRFYDDCASVIFPDDTEGSI